MSSVTENVLIVAGDDRPIRFPLTVDGAAYEITAGSTVTARLRQRGEAITSGITCESTTLGADWPNGIVAVPFSSINTELLSRGRAAIEITVITSGAPVTWISGDDILIERRAS